MGILAAQQTAGANEVGAYVPTVVAMGTAAQLAAGHAVVHGWLGVSTTGRSGGACGAEVVEVLAGSPAQRAGLVAGEVIVAVDDHPVCSQAELQGRLYVVAPQAVVLLSVESTGGAATVPATLTASLTPAG